MADIAVNVRDATFAYAKTAPVFKDISCDIRYGAIFAILGPNGQGKTSFMKTLMGLLPLSAGSVVHSDIIGFVPQSFAPAFSYSVFDIVQMGRAMHLSALQSPSRLDREKTWAALASMQLERLADREFNALSGGQKQLVLIARAIAMECRILLLDEPTSALDPGNRQRVLKLMQKLAQDDNIAIVFSTHEPVHALAIADQVMLMSPYAAPLVGKPDQVLTSQRLSLAYDTPLKVLNITHDGHEYKTVIAVDPDTKPIANRPSPEYANMINNVNRQEPQIE